MRERKIIKLAFPLFVCNLGQCDLYEVPTSRTMSEYDLICTTTKLTAT